MKENDLKSSLGIFLFVTYFFLVIFIVAMF